EVHPPMAMAWYHPTPMLQPTPTTKPGCTANILGQCQCTQNSDCWDTHFNASAGAVCFQGTCNSAQDGTVWVHLLSHSPGPANRNGATLLDDIDGSGNLVNGNGLAATFNIPGGVSPNGEKLYIGPVQSDFMVKGGVPGWSVWTDVCQDRFIEQQPSAY